MTRRSRSLVPIRRLRTALASVALALGITCGLLLTAGTASAIPPGGWCHADWYEFGSNNGIVHQPYGSVRQLTNQTAEPVTWTESITVNYTFTSTYTTTTQFQGGINLGIVSFGVSSSTQTTITQSITVSTTSTSSTVVNPGQTKYMAYGSFRLSTTGTYHRDTYGCEFGEYYGYTSGTVTGSSLVSVGWRVWT